MLLDDYINHTKQLLNEISIFAVSHSVTFDRRTQEQAHIFGYIVLIDENSFHYREFIDTSGLPLTRQ